MEVKEELHLIIVWNKGRYKEKEILEDLKSEHTIVDCIEVEWSKKAFLNNLSRFYGKKLPSRNSKIKECGKGPFLLITILDKNPDYAYIETSRGFEYVNKNLFNLKQKYRKLTNGGHKIHATNSKKETDHDLTLLLGLNSEDYLKKCKNNWNGSVQKIKRDLEGCLHWESLSQIFYVFNNTINYVVLRNFEELPNWTLNENHGDIDILADSFDEACLILNGKKIKNKPYRVHFKTDVNNKTVLWDIRYVADKYYCDQWELDLLNSRTLNQNNVFVLPSKEYFYSLLYHALVHKKQVAPDYFIKLENLYRYVNINKGDDLEAFVNKKSLDFYIGPLLSHMEDTGYQFTKPVDHSVFYNSKFEKVQLHRKIFFESYGITQVLPVQSNCAIGKPVYFYTGILNGKKVFIKGSQQQDSIKNEYFFSNLLYEKNNSNFVKPLYYKILDELSFIVFDFIDGVTFEDLTHDPQRIQSLQSEILVGFENILCALKDVGCMHRDIRPANILLSKDNGVYLIDFQHAVNVNKYREIKSLKRKPWKVYNLGGVFSKGKLKWNDCFSICMVLKALKINNLSPFVSDCQRSSKDLKYRLRVFSLIYTKVFRLLVALIPIKKIRHRFR